jgi:DNA-binding SARP family transcriptional activator
VRVRAGRGGAVEIERDGEPVRFARKVQKKPLELLRALAEAGGELSRERAEEALWPDAEGDAAHRALDTTLHRLRKLLGRDDAVQLRGATLRLERRVVFLERGGPERS